MIGGFMSESVVLFAKDPTVAQSLIGGLRPHFQAVLVTGSGDELRSKVATNHPGAVVFDIESSRLNEVANLHREFPSLPIVCTHRIPDEELWMAALEAGASDVCPEDDVNNVLTSVLRNMALARNAA
jgi:DNA-binding NarL/FixJ family response regulator